jgi:[ribosomal protein S18]-alanine N-acetyltransferase
MIPSALMVGQTSFSIRTAQPDDLPQLANLIHFETYVHRHLDYRPPLDWVGCEPFLIAEGNHGIAAALACPPDPPHVAWLRLFAVSNSMPPTPAWQTLWEAASVQLSKMPGLRWAAAIPMYDWFSKLLERQGFEHTHQIVMMNWDRKSVPEAPARRLTTIRPMTLDDLPDVADLDMAAFAPVWQNTQSYLELAFRQAVIATVAVLDGRSVGYQISTATPMGGHLARLAVEPHLQGHGIGYALIQDLLNQFARRGARSITVNTQKNNRASLTLYQRAGFQLTGEEFPFFQFTLNN